MFRRAGARVLELTAQETEQTFRADYGTNFRDAAAVLALAAEAGSAVVDQEALTNFYRWTDANNRKPTATAFSQWESKGRPSGVASPGQSGGDKNRQ